MAGLISFDVEFNDDGTAIIRHPDGRMKEVNAAKLADLTMALAEGLGEIKERHVGDHEHTHDDTTTDHTHLTA